MKMTYAIATATGQTMFLTHSQVWALAPDKRIKLFTSRKAAETHRMANLKRFNSLLSRRSLVMPATVQSTQGYVADEER